ncbi:MAG: hypothetical protein DME19_03625 [Verrucomicrobia bacterium]|nr:MAG: hypothetical protein DME19_03625 [Verrucomicrobiota bacterium]
MTTRFDPAHPKAGELRPPAPLNLVAADVRGLTFQMRSAKCGVRNAELNQSLLTSAATVQEFKVRSFGSFPVLEEATNR